MQSLKRLRNLRDYDIPQDQQSKRDHQIINFLNSLNESKTQFLKFGTLAEFDKLVEDEWGDVLTSLEEGNTLTEDEEKLSMDLQNIRLIMEALHEIDTPKSRAVLKTLWRDKILRHFLILDKVRLQVKDHYRDSVEGALKEKPIESVDWLYALVNNAKALQSIHKMSRDNFIDAPYFTSILNEQSQKTGQDKLDIQLPQTQLDDWIDIVNESNEFWSTLSEDQKEAIRVQTNSTSKDDNRDGLRINQFLRGGPDTVVRKRLTSDWVKILDSVFCSPDMPKFRKSTTVFRGIDRVREKNVDLLNDSGFKSTTLQGDTASEHCQASFSNQAFCVILQIEIPAGFPFFKIPSQGTRWSESEIILNRSSRFVPTKGSFTISYPVEEGSSTLQIVRVKAVYNFNECI